MKTLSAFALLSGLLGMVVLRQSALGPTLANATFTFTFGLLIAGGLAGLALQRLRYVLELD